ncbi:UNVERIFIED_CONTAM: isoprenylcysteine carboxylmethyltransferase family protein [Halobacillus marinus]|nr:isoprenylcysteine carboxylmethyltransferase family protein [Bacillus sp. SB49]
MNLFELLFLFVTILWIGEFALFRNHHSTKGGGEAERRSFPIILITVLLAVCATLIMREWNFGILSIRWVWWVGLLIYAAGVWLRYWGIMHLKDQFTRDVSVKKGDKLVSTGPYRWLRHPLYTGLFSIIIGFCLGVGNIYTAFVCGALVASALLHRIRLEEAMLVEEHGEKYKDWCRRRYRLIPFVY